MELQNSGCKRRVTEHANCHTEGCGPAVVEQLGVVLHQTHYLSVRYGNRPSESLRSILAAVGCRRSPGSSLNPGPRIRDPERRLPLCQPLGIALPFIKPSFANASCKLWVPVGHGDSSQAVHCLCPCPGQYQWKEYRLGQQRLASVGLGPGRWAGSQHSTPVPGSLALAGQGSTVGLPCSGVICGSLVSFIEKHVPRRGWRLGRGLYTLDVHRSCRESCYSLGLCDTLKGPLKCPGADTAMDKGSTRDGRGRLYQSTSHQASSPA